jgi:hypothetical protein
MNEPMKAKLTVVKKPHTELQEIFNALDREEVECKSLLAKRSTNELRVYSKKSIESEERTNKMIQDRKNAKFVKAVTESFSIISS